MNPSTRRTALDCSRPATACFWIVAGAALALAAITVQGPPTWGSLLRVGSKNPLKQQIERELGPLTSSTDTGHDGQLYYLIARDPFGRGDTVGALTAFDTPRYRYRRIFFPLLAGGAGQFSPKMTLFMMVALCVGAMSLVAVGLADLTFTQNLRPAAVFPALLNLGALVSVMLLTVDALALGLSLAGAALLARGRWQVALLVLTGAVLTKETYLLVPVGLGAWHWIEGRKRLGLALVVAPTVLLFCWSMWLVITIPGIPEPGLLGTPVIGMLSSIANWISGAKAEGVQGLFAAYTLMSLVLATLMTLMRRNRLLRSMAIPWLVLACITGEGVWGIPTNIARAFAILWPLALLLAFEPPAGSLRRRT